MDVELVGRVINDGLLGLWIAKAAGVRGEVMRQVFRATNGDARWILTDDGR